MNYSSLTKVQKRCIDAFVALRPELATAETITRPEIEDMFKTLYEARENGGEKIGYPMWLVKGEKVGRGQYKFPAPGLAQDTTSAVEQKASKSAAIQNAEEDKEFFQDLQEYGIMEKA